MIKSLKKRYKTMTMWILKGVLPPPNLLAEDSTVFDDVKDQMIIKSSGNESTYFQA